MKRSNSPGMRSAGRGSPAARKPRSKSLRAPCPMRSRAWFMASGASPSSARITFSVPTRSGAVSTRVPSRSKAITAPSRRLAAIDDRDRPVELAGVGLERLAGQADVLLGVVEPPLLQRLAYARQGLGAIAGEAPGRIDHVHVPGPAR